MLASILIFSSQNCATCGFGLDIGDHGSVTACGLQAQVAFYSFLLSEWCSNNRTGALWCVSVGSLCSQWGRVNLWGEGLGISSGWISWAGGKNCYAAAGLFIYQHVHSFCRRTDNQTSWPNRKNQHQSNCGSPQLLRRTFLSSHSTFHVILCDQWPIGNKTASTYIIQQLFPCWCRE